MKTARALADTTSNDGQSSFSALEKKAKRKKPRKVYELFGTAVRDDQRKEILCLICLERSFRAVNC